MWCSRKGIDCPDCGMFGECFRTVWCGLPDRRLTTAGTTAGTTVQEIHDNSNYLRRETMNTAPDEIEISGVKYRKLEERAI